MIKFENVVKRYGETTAVDNLNLEIKERELCILIGPSGCGKTTSLRMINRMIELTRGIVYINNKDVKNSRPEFLRRQIGYVIQNIGLFPHMSVKDNISTVPKLLGWSKEKIKSRTEELLHLVGLSSSEYSRKFPRELSGGEAQRVGVARALAADPPILLMDEPFGAVDPLNRVRLQDAFARIQKELKKTVVFVTHDIDEAIRLGDRIAIMRFGKLVQYDTPENLLSFPKNKFVHDFIGADRALKKLSRIPVEKHMLPAKTISNQATIEEIKKAIKRGEYIWVINEENRVMGWLDVSYVDDIISIGEALTPIEEDETVSVDSTLREAISKMLGHGIETLPVVDKNNNIVGEISLEIIQKVTRSTNDEKK